MNERVCLVTGGSSGIGKETVRILSSRGFRVYEFSRSDAAGSGLATHMRVDVTDEKSVTQAVDKIVNEHGRIDLVINCAGFGISGAVEFTESAEAKKQFDVNFFGMVNVNRAVIRHMRERRSGRIVNISSLAAVIPIPFQAFYSASKAAMNSYTCALANELKAFNISVCAIQPGDIATSFTRNREKSPVGDDVYSGIIGKSVGRMEQDERHGMSVRTAARLIADIALKKTGKPLYAIHLHSSETPARFPGEFRRRAPLHEQPVGIPQTAQPRRLARTLQSEFSFLAYDGGHIRRVKKTTCGAN